MTFRTLTQVCDELAERWEQDRETFIDHGVKLGDLMHAAVISYLQSEVERLEETRKRLEQYERDPAQAERDAKDAMRANRAALREKE